MRYSASRLKLFFIHIILVLPMCVWGQTYDQITSSAEYVHGLGEAASALQADRLALASVSEQISVAVRSEFEIHNRKTTNDVINTYSSSTLTNCKKLVLENGPTTFRILRYIHNDEIARMFKSREQKVLEMVGIALRAEEERKYDVALKHYYWAQLMLETLVYPNDVYYETADGDQKQVVLWLPLQINNILDNLSFEFGGYASEDKTLATIYVTHKGVPVTSLDYSYWDGMDWSITTQAKDGLSAIELRANSNVSSINVKIEYSYEQEMHIDPDFLNIAEFFSPKQYTKAYKNSIQLTVPKKPQSVVAQQEENVKVESVVIKPEETEMVAVVDDLAPYKDTVSSVINAINSRNYESARGHFTEAGYEVYSKLIAYGRAKTLSGQGFNPIEDIEVTKFEGDYICRSIPMQFSFSGNKSFVENVVFIFDGEGKISSVQFSLERVALNDILSKRQWSASAKMILINFLENYKTAFALSRIDYLDSVFSEDALIITGRVVKRTNVEGQINLQNKEYIVYNRQTKGEYINNLRRSFKSKEYINLQFSNLKITKMGRGDKEIYCMEIKQDYYSSNYADTGYLMLVVDVTEYSQPIIHVRTWQPEPDPEFGLFTPGHV